MLGRTSNLFAIAGGVLLLLGALERYVIPNIGLSFSWGGKGYGLSWQTPCYGVAAFFCLCAFFYSIGYFPIGGSQGRWHFFLSLVSVVLVAVGFWILGFAASRTAPGESQGLWPMLIALSWFGGGLIFVVTQMWFLIEAERALLRARQM